jgi:hypothetical protein
MIHRKVLIVDDELQITQPSGRVENPRDEIYKILIEHLNAIDVGHYFYEAIWCGSEEGAVSELSGISHSSGELVAIVDLVLHEGSRFSEVGSGELLDSILEKSRLVYFTTRRLESAKIETLVKFQRAERSAGLFPFELIREQPREFARLIHRGLQKHTSGQVVDYVEFIQSRGFSTVNVLLLSDFHFNQVEPGSTIVDLENAFEAIGAVLGDRRLDLAVLAGDFLDKGATAGFRAAQSFAMKLCELANFQTFPSDFLSVVPGNHDVVVPLALASHIARRDGSYFLETSVVNSHLSRFSLQPFQHFRERVSKGVQYFGQEEADEVLSRRHWIDSRWEALGFVTVGFDSNSVPSATSAVLGEIDSGSLSKFRSLFLVLPKARRRRLMLIVVTHHYSGDGGADRGITQRDELRRFCSELGFKGVIFVSGDRHGDPLPQIGRQLSGEGTLPLEIAVPTFCQENALRQKDASRGFLLLTLQIVNNEVVGADVRPYTFREGGTVESSRSRHYILADHGWRIT